MAFIKPNGTLHSLQQLLKALLSLLPSKAEPLPRDFTPQQLRFRQAVAFAKTVRTDPGSRRPYARMFPDCRSFYHLALRDALCGPQLDQLSLANSPDGAGLVFRVRVMDNVAVAQVLFQFLSTTGKILEEGRGRISGNCHEWSYTTCSNAGELVNSMATITAFDLAGNKAVIHKSI